jgi:TonB family protein
MPSYASAHIHAGGGGARGEGLGRGEDPEASSGGDSARKSRGWGKWKKHHDFVMAQLENFVPEVKPGNQTALNTRADPFARYIARMHTRIHRGWGFGLLEDLMTKPSSHPMNDLKLWAVVEIVLKNDGTVEKLTVIRRSGVMVFDAAAVEVVAAAGPFSRPPPSIVSGNGKVYVHWQFNRDERQCGTFGATPFILDNGAERGKAPTASTGSDQVYHVREIPLPSSGGDATPPRRGEDRRAGGLTREIALPDAGARALPAREHPEARRTASRWLKALASHDHTELTVLSRVPFTVGGRVIARSEAQLNTLANELFKDVPKAVASSIDLYRAAGLRARFGSTPPGASDGDGRLYAVGRVGKEAVILHLASASGSSWRVDGLTR